MTKQERIEKIQNEFNHIGLATDLIYVKIMIDKKKRKIFQDYFQLLQQFTYGDDHTHELQVKKIKTILIHMINNDLA